MDAHLPGGGLPLGGLHEIEGARVEWDEAAATGFTLALLARLCAAAPAWKDGGPGGGTVLWAGAAGAANFTESLRGIEH